MSKRLKSQEKCGRASGRSRSSCTAGQFDTPDDPELLKLQQILRGMTFKVRDDRTKVETTERMFDTVSPFPVPKQ